MSYITICHRGDCNFVVFRNDFETSVRLKQPTNQRSSSADQEISRHEKHRQSLTGNFQCILHIMINKESAK